MTTSPPSPLSTGKQSTQCAAPAVTFTEPPSPSEASSLSPATIKISPPSYPSPYVSPASKKREPPFPRPARPPRSSMSPVPALGASPVETDTVPESPSSSSFCFGSLLSPVRMMISPVSPLVVLPVCRLSAPDAPPMPPSAVCRVAFPLLLGSVSPQPSFGLPDSSYLISLPDPPEETTTDPAVRPSSRERPAVSVMRPALRPAFR
mmetsp:Transcript_963/g.3636  ORF Transcript_963/g.3636 Transcript_963/m.3636 type:complete len:206 (+) Transcript_963:1901-2518(+)